MSSRSSSKVEKREDVITKLYNNKFGNLSQDIQEIIEQKIQEQEQKEKEKKNYKYSKYTNYENDSLLKQNIITTKPDIDKNKIINNIGGRRNNMSMKDIKYMCKANQIKLSRVVNGVRIIYTKKELITKLKRKKII